MRQIVATVLALAGVAFATPVVAQGRDRVVVTANRIDRDGSGLPNVSLLVPADFVLFTLQLETGTRSADERVRELERSFTTLTQRTRTAQGLSIEVGTPWESAAIETTAIREIVVPHDDGPDRYVIPILIKADVRAGDTFPSVRARVQRFVDETQLNGRVEAVMGEDQYIGVNDPKKHREELLRKIAAETRQLQQIFNEASTGATALGLTGLGGRVQTRPNGPLELEMYIDYDVVLSSPEAH